MILKVGEIAEARESDKRLNIRLHGESEMATGQLEWKTQ